MARNHKKDYGKTSLKKILQQTRDIRTFSLTPEQYREFSHQAKDKVLFAGIQENVLSDIIANAERSSKKESRSERSSDDIASSSPTSRKNSKNERPSIGEQLQSFHEKLSGVEPHVPTREKTHSEITK